MDKSNPEVNKERLAEQYDQFVAQSHEFFKAGRDMSKDALIVAMDKAREQMTVMGELSAEQAATFKDYMKRDLEQTADDMSRLGEAAKEHLNPTRLGAGALSTVASLLQLSADSLRQWSKKAEQELIYKEGEVASAGTFTCTTCKHQMHWTKSGTIPLCPNCRGITFRKGY